MTHRQIGLTVSIVAILVASLVTPVFALGVDDVKARPERLVEDGDEPDEDNVGADGTKRRMQHSAEELLTRQKEHISERKSELEARLSEKRTERKERLEGRKLARCQNREDKINQLLERSVGNGKKRLEAIQKFEEGVKNFYTKESLSSAGYDAAVVNADDKEAAAIAAIDVMASQKFECSTVDGVKPSGAIREIAQSRHEALKAYRTAVRDLLLVVKKALRSDATTTDRGA